jgi:hypothetical protein
MPVNNKQKLVLIDIDANTVATLQARLAQGYVIEFMISLLPTFTKILIVYALPPDEV